MGSLYGFVGLDFARIRNSQDVEGNEAQTFYHEIGVQAMIKFYGMIEL